MPKRLKTRIVPSRREPEQAFDAAADRGTPHPAARQAWCDLLQGWEGEGVDGAGEREGGSELAPELS